MKTDTLAVTRVLPQVNLLPPEIVEYEQLQRSQRFMALTVLGPVLLTAVLLLLGRHPAAEAQRSLDAAQQEHTALLARQSALNDVPVVEAALAARQAQLTLAMGSEVDWAEQLQQLSLRMPPRVFLLTLTALQTGTPGGTAGTVPGGLAAPPVAGAVPGIGTVAFTGTAASHDDVARWLRTIAAMPGYADPTFSTSKEKQLGGKTVVDFSSTVVLTDRAESGRYRTPGKLP